MALQVKSGQFGVCRICLVPTCKDRVKFELKSEWSQTFEYCVSLPVTAGKAPLEFCRACANKLQDFSKFKNQCLESESLWKSTSCEEELNIEGYEAFTDIKDEPMYEEYLSDNSYDEEDFHTYNLPLKLNDNKVSIQKLKATGEVKVEKVKKEKMLNKIKEDKDEKYYEEIEIVEGSLMPVKTPKLSGEKKVKKKPYGLKRKPSNGLKKYMKGRPRKNKTPKPEAKQTVKPTKPPKVKEPEIYNCGICEYTATEHKNIKQHFNEHSANNDLVCKLCDYVGQDFAKMVYHRYSHISTNDRADCPSCTKQLLLPVTLEFHYRKVHLKEKGGLCGVCDKGFVDYRAWRKHEKIHLKGHEKYICDFCGIECRYRCSLITHLKEHEEKCAFICDTCGRGFKRMANLRSHISNRHTPSVPVKCTHCNRMFKNEFNLKNHMFTENREKKYICDVCSKGYGTESMLKSHMFWHTGERPYACELCGSKYKAKSQLKVHLRSHSGYKPYKCPHCDKEFMSSQVLKRHQSVHTGVRRVKCLYCDRTFHGKSLMIKHCISRHKVDIAVDKSDL